MVIFTAVVTKMWQYAKLLRDSMVLYPLDILAQPWTPGIISVYNLQFIMLCPLGKDCH